EREFFINDVRTRLLKPDGRLLLEFNRRSGGSSFFTPQLRAFFESQGAPIVSCEALLAADPNPRPRFTQIGKIVGQAPRLPTRNRSGCPTIARSQFPI